MKYLVLLSLLFVVSCSTVQPTTVKDIPEFHPPMPRPVQMREVEWRVLQQDQPYFCLSDRNYENLSMNMEEFQRYIRQLRTNLEYYGSSKKNTP